MFFPFSFIAVAVGEFVGAFAVSLLIDDFSLVLVIIGVLYMLGYLLRCFLRMVLFPEQD
jgi:hypothetical protein